MKGKGREGVKGEGDERLGTKLQVVFVNNVCTVTTLTTRCFGALKLGSTL